MLVLAFMFCPGGEGVNYFGSNKMLGFVVGFYRFNETENFLDYSLREPTRTDLECIRYLLYLESLSVSLLILLL